ncbi:MAG TPA: phage holin family protein [Candidatus Woesebacteria bacterium]|nr:phage holin family protein [Candidatus Woesebacteria bacterium]HPJ17091.1 phage holin family protein [Candidatus Woesebacteria bacterium]
MKKILKQILIYSYALLLHQEIWLNLTFDHRLQTLLLVAIILTFFDFILKPIIKLLLLPINILTLGTFRLVINTLGFYLATFLLSDFHLQNINRPAFSFLGLAIPQIVLENFFAYLITSLSVNIIVGIYKFILKSKKIPQK